MNPDHFELLETGIRCALRIRSIRSFIGTRWPRSIVCGRSGALALRRRPQRRVRLRGEEAERTARVPSVWLTAFCPSKPIVVTFFVVN